MTVGPLRRAAAVVLAVCAGIVGIAVDRPTVEALPPPSQRIFMVSDSVGLGAVSAMPAAFPPGWQVTVVGKPAQFTESLATNFVRPQPASVFGDVAIVAAGYNYPYWDPARFDRSIDLMVATLLSKGVKHVLWVTLREVDPRFISASAWRQVQPYYWYFPRVNQHLRDALARHPSMSLVDWASIADRWGLTYDAIHLNTFGAGEYSRLAARVALTAPRRLPADTTRVVPLAGVNGVPADAAGVAVTVTGVNPRTRGFITVWPCGTPRPPVSTLNMRPGETTATSIILPLGEGGAICTSSNIATHIVLDVTGVFTADSGFVDVPPERVVDTRRTAALAPGTVLTVPTAQVPGLPGDRRAVVLNLTTLGGLLRADVRVFPCGTPGPAVPHRSADPGAVQNLLVVSATDAEGRVCVTATQPTHIVLDVFGAFAATADVTPLAPRVVLDTTLGAPVAPSAQQEVALGAFGVAPTATGAVLAVTSLAAANTGFVTAWPCGVARPNVSMLNMLPNRDRTGSALVALGADARVCISPSTSTHLVARVSGWTGSGFTPITPFRALDTRLG